MNAGLSWLPSTPVVYKDKIYFGSSDEHVFHGLEAEKGTEILNFYIGSRVWCSPVIAGATAFFGDEKGIFCAFDLEEEQPRWTLKTSGAIRSSTYIHEGVLYFGNDSGSLYAMR